jgi:large subunit ribosomal protein L29
MKIKELRGLSKEDMNARLTELRKELIKHNAQITTGTVPKSPGQVKQTKKTIARILTILKEKGEEKRRKETKKEQSSKAQEKKSSESKKTREA